MRLLLDTNRYTDLARGDAMAGQVVQSAEMIRVPFVVLGELRAGFVGGTRQGENETALDRFLATAGVTALFAGMTTTRLYAVLVAHLHREGTPIPTNDVWIAALALQHDLVLFSRDAHFQKVPNLRMI